MAKDSASQAYFEAVDSSKAIDRSSEAFIARIDAANVTDADLHSGLRAVFQQERQDLQNSAATPGLNEEAARQKGLPTWDLVADINGIIASVNTAMTHMEQNWPGGRPGGDQFAGSNDGTTVPTPITDPTFLGTLRTNLQGVRGAVATAKNHARGQ